MNRSKSGLFLMELLIAICFFAVASAVCVQLFAHAHTLSQRSKGIQMAVLQAQSVAEGFRGFEGDIETLALFWQADVVDGGFVAWFDDGWANVPEIDRFEMIVQTDFLTVPATIDIVITDTLLHTELYSTSILRFIGR